MEQSEFERAREKGELDQYSHEDDMITSPQIDYTSSIANGIVSTRREDGELLELDSDAIDGIGIEDGPDATEILVDRDHDIHGEHNEELEVSMDDEYSNIDEEEAEYSNFLENFEDEPAIHDNDEEEAAGSSIAATSTGGQVDEFEEGEDKDIENSRLDPSSDIQRAELIVIELVSDDDVENLEEDTREPNPQDDLREYRAEDALLDSQNTQTENLSEFGDDDHENEDETEQPIQSQVISFLQVSSFSPADASSEEKEEEDNDQLVELTRSQYEETGVSSAQREAGTRYQPSDIQAKLKSPIYIVICGDKYLLAPFHLGESVSESIISLFSWDEIADCTILEFLLFLRQNGDLIDAYNFNSNDELKLRFSELQICITEDTIQSRDTKLADLLLLFQSLKENSSNIEGTPRELTIHLSMQTRFVTQLAKLRSVCSEGKGFESIKHCFVDENGQNSELEDESPKKKRRIVS